MNNKIVLSRITLNIPKATHRKLKSRAAVLGTSMRAMILQAIELSDACIESDHIPNKETVKAIKDARAGKGVVKGKRAEAFSKKLGI